MQVGEMSSEGCYQLEVVAGEKTTGNRGGRARFLEAGSVKGMTWLGARGCRSVDSELGMDVAAAGSRLV